MSQFLPVTKKDMERQRLGSGGFCLRDRRCLRRSFLLLVLLLSAAFWRAGAIKWESSHSPTGAGRRVLPVFGEPRLGFLVSAGNMDSMVNHYTVAKKHRQKDAYSPGGKMGLAAGPCCQLYTVI